MELDELYWFLERKPRMETRENIYIMTMARREPRQITKNDAFTVEGVNVDLRMISLLWHAAAGVFFEIRKTFRLS